jgi:hypothetical protein
MWGKVKSADIRAQSHRLLHLEVDTREGKAEESEEKNNGYVAFKLNIQESNIQGSAGKRGVGGCCPTPFYCRLLDRYFKTTWTIFPVTSVFASCWHHLQTCLRLKVLWKISALNGAQKMVMNSLSDIALKACLVLERKISLSSSFL